MFSALIYLEPVFPPQKSQSHFDRPMLWYVEESIGNVEQKTDMLKKQQGRGTTGSTTSEKSAERTTTLTVPSREHMRSLTGKYVSDDLGVFVPEAIQPRVYKSPSEGEGEAGSGATTRYTSVRSVEKYTVQYSTKIVQVQ